MDEYLKFFVPGMPKTKGSMTAYKGGRMLQNVQGSREWGLRVERHARSALSENGSLHPLPEDFLFPPGFAVSLRVDFFLPCPSTVSEPVLARPISQSSGDIDKLLRNILDALQKAKVFANDAQVVEIVSTKEYVQGSGKCGCRIHARETDHLD